MASLAHGIITGMELQVFCTEILYPLMKTLVQEMIIYRAKCHSVNGYKLSFKLFPQCFLYLISFEVINIFNYYVILFDKFGST